MAKRASKTPFRVAVAGESSFDTEALRDLLHRQYGARAQFMAFPLRLEGGQLDGNKSNKMFRLTYEAKRPDLVVIFRDLDGPENDLAKRQERAAYFQKANALVEHKGLLLLHVYTIEALLIAHIEVFQKKYGWQCRVPSNPTTIAKPTQFLRDASRNSKRPYEKALCPNMMEQVDYSFLTSRCRYFHDFDAQLAALLPLVN